MAIYEQNEEYSFSALQKVYNKILALPLKACDLKANPNSSIGSCFYILIAYQAAQGINRQLVLKQPQTLELCIFSLNRKAVSKFKQN